MCGAHTAPAVSPSVYHSRAHTQGPLEWVGGNLPPKDSFLPREPSPPPWDKPGSLSPQIRKFQVPRKESASLSLSLPCLPPPPPPCPTNEEKHLLYSESVVFSCQLREAGVGRGQEHQASREEPWWQLGVLPGRGKLEGRDKGKGVETAGGGEKGKGGERGRGGCGT